MLSSHAVMQNSNKNLWCTLNIIWRRLKASADGHQWWLPMPACDSCLKCLPSMTARIDGPCVACFNHIYCCHSLKFMHSLLHVAMLLVSAISNINISQGIIVKFITGLKSFEDYKWRIPTFSMSWYSLPADEHQKYAGSVSLSATNNIIRNTSVILDAVVYSSDTT